MARGERFQQFRDQLACAQGNVVVVCPNAQFAYWAKRMVQEVLGKPQVVQGDRWCYSGRTVHFALAGNPSGEYRLRGLDQSRVIRCDGSVTDDYLGMQR